MPLRYVTGFRCCYCYHLNEARKQKPRAPSLGEHEANDRQAGLLDEASDTQAGEHEANDTQADEHQATDTQADEHQATGTQAGLLDEASDTQTTSVEDHQATDTQAKTEQGKYRDMTDVAEIRRTVNSALDYQDNRLVDY